MKKLRELYVRCKWWRETWGMSALGLELRTALMKDKWNIGMHTIKHERSGIDLWVGASARFLRIYDVPHVRLKDDEKEEALNSKDRKVLHMWAQRLVDKTKTSKPEQIMAVLLASQFKDD